MDKQTYWSEPERRVAVWLQRHELEFSYTSRNIVPVPFILTGKDISIAFEGDVNALEKLQIPGTLVEVSEVYPELELESAREGGIL